MNILIDRLTGQAYITHNNKSVSFNMGLYREGRTTKSLSEAKDYFLVLDQYIQTLPMHEQNSIWNMYATCRHALDNTLSVPDMEKIIMDEINKISDIITIDKLRFWYGTKSLIPIPSELKESLADLPDPTLATEDQTYLRNDYIGLCALSMAMTMLAPIFSAYVEKTKGEHGTEWKTYYAYLLISKSSYFKSVELERLQRYIEVTLDSMANIKYDTIILSGISKEEYPTWIMAIVVTKKVATGDITGDPTVHPLIKYIYKYIQQKVQSMDKDFHGRVKHRTIQANASSEDSQVSILEAYNSRQMITDNLVVICDYYLKDIVSTCHKLDKTIPLELIEESSATANKLVELMYSSDITEGQIVLLKWVLSRVIPTKMIDYLSRDTIISAILIARTYLWHNGFYDLAALISAIPLDNKEEHMVTGTDKRSRIVRTYSNRIDEVFPYYRKTTGSKKPKITKSVQVSADEIESMLNKNDWYLTLPDSWLATDLLGTQSRHYAISDDIKLSIIDLAILIATSDEE